MLKRILALLLVSGMHNLYSQGCSLVSFSVASSPTSAKKADTTVCKNSTLNLTASNPVLKQTTSYTVAPITYLDVLPCESTGTTVAGATLQLDDRFTCAQNIGFDFCFYNNVFSQLVIADNGYLNLSATNAATGVLCNNSPRARYTSQSLPLAAAPPAAANINVLPANSILGAWFDLLLDPALNGSGSITVQTVGAAPFRAFIVKYINCAYFTADCRTDTTKRLNMKIVLYETTNMIDVYIKTKPICTGTMFLYYRATQGLVGTTIAQNIVTPGRNNSYWDGVNSAYRFIPDGANYATSIQWKKNGTVISSTNSAVITATDDSATYVATSTITATCPANVLVVSDSIKVRGLNNANLKFYKSDTLRCRDTLTLNGFKAGAIKYSWQDNSTLSTKLINGAGNYFVVRNYDTLGCSKDTLFFTVIKFPDLKIDSIQRIGCFTNLNNGQVKIFVSGDTTGIKYGLVSTPSSSSNIINSQGYGTTKFYVTSSNGCKDSMTIFKDSFISAYSKRVPKCIQDTSGMMKLVTSGGWAPLIYTLNGILPQSKDSFTNVGPGIYTIAVTDKAGCVKSVLDTIKVIPNLFLSVVVDTVLCFGGNTGKITATLTGGTAPYNYSLSLGTFIKPGIFSNLTANVYNLRAKDTFGCQVDTNIPISQGPDFIVSNTKVKSCPGINSGSLTISASGGKAPYQYRLNAGAYQTSNVFSGIVNGIYTISIRDANNCVKIITDTLASYPKPDLVLGVKYNVSCYLSTNGRIKVNTSNGTGPYIYNWTNGYVLDSIFNLPVGTYTAIVSDANNCKDTLVTSISQPDSIHANFILKNPLCFNGNSGTIKVTGTGGISPYTYAINGGGFSSIDSFTGLAAQIHVIQVRDTNLCLKSFNRSLINPIKLSTSLILDTVACFGGNTGKITMAGLGGKSPYTYSINGGGYVSSNVFNSLSANVYNLSIKDSNNCIFDTVATILQNPDINISLVKVRSCLGFGNGSITASASGGKPTYQYRIDLGTYQASNVFSSLLSGVHTIYVRDIKNCIKSLIDTLIPYPKPDLSLVYKTNLSCYQSNNGKIKVTTTSGTPAYVYSWSTGGSLDSISNLAIGNYTATVTDANTCKDTFTTSIIQPDSISASFNLKNPLCHNGSTGSIKVVGSGGSPSYNYALNAGSYSTLDSFTGLSSLTYSILVRDANLCVKVFNRTLINPTKVTSASILVDSVACFGGNTGKITHTGTGGKSPYQYSINFGAFGGSNIFSNLTSGSYNISIRDSNNCVFDTMTNVLEYPKLNLAINILDTIRCKNGNDGRITAVGSGGKTPYQYSINGGGYGANPIFSNLIKGKYIIAIKDAKNCITIDSLTLAEPPGITSTLTIQKNVTCFGDSNAKAKVVVVGGIVPYLYTWSNGTSLDSVVNLKKGNHFIKIIDTKLCKDSIPFVITEPDSLRSSFNMYHPKCFDSLGSIKVNTLGGTTPYLISVNGGGFSSIDSFSNLIGQPYSFIIRDNNLCSRTYSRTLVTPSKIISSFLVDSVKCFGASTGKITMTASGGTGALVYKKNTVTQANNIFNALSAGSYAIQISDANNCKLDSNINVYQYPDINIFTTKLNINCFGQSTGEIITTATGGNGPGYQFSINSGAFGFNNTFKFLSANLYTIQVQDANNCIKSVQVTLTQKDSIQYSLTKQNNKCFNDSLGKIKINILNGGTSPFIYSFNGGSTYNAIDSISLLPAGTFNLSIKDSHNCIKNFSTPITHPTKLQFTTNLDSVKCFKVNTGKITVNSSGGTPAYQYSIDSINYQASNIFTSLAAGNFKVFLRDANQCKKDSIVTIFSTDSLYANIVVDSIKCHNQTGQVIVTPVGGQPSYQYKLLSGVYNSNPIISGISSGAHTVAVRDQYGCEVFKLINLQNPSQIIITKDSQINNPCFGYTNGKLQVSSSGGSLPHKYLWSNTDTTTSISNLASGNFTVSVTDTKNCLVTSTYSISQPSQIVPTPISTQNVKCFGETNGLISIVTNGGTGPYTYLWSNGETTTLIDSLPKGTYTLTVTDNLNCTTTLSRQINEPGPIVHSLTVQKSHCIISNDVKITANIVSGGTPGFDFIWSNGAPNTNVCSNLTPFAKYYLTISDANLCKKYDSAYIDTMYVLRANVQNPNPGKCANSLLNIEIQTNGSPPIQYTLGSFAVNDSGKYKNIRNAVYPILVKDNFNCQLSFVEDLKVKDTMVVDLINYKPDCKFSNLWPSKVNISGGLLPYTVNWPLALSTFNVINDSATHNLPGFYQVQVRDGNNCLVTKRFLIESDNDALTGRIINKKNLRCYDLPEGEMTVLAKGGAPPYKYKWAHGPLTEIVKGLSANTVYQVSISDRNDCSYISSDTLTQPDSMSFKFNKSDQTCIGDFNGSIVVLAEGGTAPNRNYTYSLDSNLWQTENFYLTLDSGNYKIWVRDENLCAQYKPTRIETEYIAKLTLDSLYQVFLGNTIKLTPTVTIIPNTGIFNYLWTPSDGLSCSDCLNPEFQGYHNSQYVFSVFYGNGCKDSIRTQVLINDKNLLDFYVPNTFSPFAVNPENQVFRAYGNLISRFSMKIFNRWGEKVYESDDMKEGWNGYYKNELAPNGVYNYIIDAETIHRKKILKSGSLLFAH